MEEREPLMDQYGIRTRLNVEGETIKFEIVLEGRVRLDPPSPEDTVCTVSCLTLADMACSKLLANSDRWNDDGVFSRDLLDLAHLPLKPNQLINALSKAEGAYGESVQKDLIQSLERLLGRASGFHPDGHLLVGERRTRPSQPAGLPRQRVRATSAHCLESLWRCERSRHPAQTLPPKLGGQHTACLARSGHCCQRA